MPRETLCLPCVTLNLAHDLARQDPTPRRNAIKREPWAHVMLRSLSIKMGESVHDGPEASNTNAALCAAMQRVLSKCRCNFIVACFVLSMLHACRQETGRYPATGRDCRLALFFWHKGTREAPVVKWITCITCARKHKVGQHNRIKKTKGPQ